MNFFLNNFLKFLILLGTCLSSHGQNLVTYTEPTQNFKYHSTLYKVVLRQRGIIKNSYVYVSKTPIGVTSWEWAKQENKTFNYTTFSFRGKVSVEVIKINSKSSSAILRPSINGDRSITCTKQGEDRTIKFTIKEPGKFSVEFDDDPNNKDALMIFADAIESTAIVPDSNMHNIFYVDTSLYEKPIKVDEKASIIYFKPGIYNIGLFNVPAYVNQIYISGGAFVRGYIYAKRTNNQLPLKINGRGILSNDVWPFRFPIINDKNSPNWYYSISKDWYKSIRIEGGKKHLIEGITLVDGTSFNIIVHADSSIITNVKIHGFRYNNDGITISGANHLIDECFFHLSDDAISLGEMKSIVIKNCIFWQLSGSCIQFGWYPHSMNGQNIIENCHIIHAEWKNSAEQNAGFINAINFSNPSPNSMVENFLIQNIFFDTDVIRIIDIRMNRPNSKQPNQFKNFYFKNIRALVSPENNNPAIYLNGYDSQHMISNFHFEDIYINNVLINTNNYSEKGYFKIGDYTEKIQFK